MKKLLVTIALACCAVALMLPPLPARAGGTPDSYTVFFQNAVTGVLINAHTSEVVSGWVKAIKVDLQSPYTTCGVYVATWTNGTDQYQEAVFGKASIAADAVYYPRFPIHGTNGVALLGATNIHEKIMLVGQRLVTRVTAVTATNKDIRITIKLER